MRTVLVVAVIAVLLGSVAPVPVAAQEDVVTLTVSVQAPNGSGVSNAELNASWDGGSTTETTAGNGMAFIDVPEGADVSIEVTSDRYVRNEPFTVTDASEQDVTIDVYRKATVEVSVSDQSGPLADAQVIVRQRGDVVTVGRTASDGVFETEAIEAGDYGVTVRKRGYYRNTTDLEVTGTTTTSLQVRRGSVTLQFNVTDPHFAPPEPVGDVTLNLDSVGQFQTLASGEQDVRVPVNAELDLAASKEGYETTNETITVEEESRTVNVSISRTPSLNLTPVSNRIVAGEVVVVTVENEYEEPVQGATVLLDGNSVAETDSDGEAQVRIESVGDHTLRARAGGVSSTPSNVTALEGNGQSDTATGTDTTTATETTDGSVPGFTVTTAVLAVLAALVLFWRRD